MNVDFYKKVKRFSSKVNGLALTIDLLNLRGNEKIKNTYVILNTSKETLEILSSIYADDKRTVEDLLFEFLIYDDTNEWAIYCNLGSDIGIGGCSDSVYEMFMKEINPYEKYSFETKMNDLTKSFIDIDKQNSFVEELISNFKFTVKE
jgi:hypothetical protein